MNMESNGLIPPLLSIHTRAKEINLMFNLQKLEESNAVTLTERFEDKLFLALEHIQALYKGLSLKDKDVVKIKITTCGKRLKVTNIGFVVIIIGNFISIYHILAITTCPEKYLVLKPVLDDTIKFISSTNTFNFKGTTLTLQFCFCADLKFMNEMMVIGACSSKYCCLWCKTASDNFFDVEADCHLRSLEETRQLLKMPGKSRLKFFACVHVNPPMFPIDYGNVVMDAHHLYLRISDQLIQKLILELKTQDNITKNSKALVLNGPVLVFSTDKTGLLEYRDFTGPEHKTIQSNIELRGRSQL